VRHERFHVTSIEPGFVVRVEVKEQKERERGRGREREVKREDKITSLKLMPNLQESKQPLLII
jgi:hypothetical protein